MAAANNQPIPGGYDTDAFLQKPDDDYICTICQSVLREPVMTRCGHRFCKACLEEWWRSRATTECPFDRETLDRDKGIFPDKATERKILSLHQRCPNRDNLISTMKMLRDPLEDYHRLLKKIRCVTGAYKWDSFETFKKTTRKQDTDKMSCQSTGELRCAEDPCEDYRQLKKDPCEDYRQLKKGCQWTGELRYVENHRRECDGEIITCPNNNCGYSCARIEMKDHETSCDWRIVACTHCGQQYPKINEEEHNEGCHKFPMDCKLGCRKQIPREKMDVHCKDICPLTVMSCEYEDLGCTTKMKRKDLNHHLNDNMGLHLKLSRLKILNLQEELDEYRVAPFVWKIPHFRELITRRAGKVDIYSPPVYSKRYEYRFLARFSCTTSRINNTLFADIAIVKGDYDDLLAWPCDKIIRPVLLNGAVNNRTFAKALTGSGAKRFHRPTTKDWCDDNSVRWLINNFSLNKLNINDTLYLQFEIEN